LALLLLFILGMKFPFFHSHYLGDNRRLFFLYLAALKTASALRRLPTKN
jgi:hypothetical protein